MLSFIITIITYNSITDTIHSLQYYELIQDRIDLRDKLNKIDRFNHYADIIISIFSGLVSVMLTPLFKKLGEKIIEKYFKKKVPLNKHRRSGTKQT
jgi:hypothetical protein